MNRTKKEAIEQGKEALRLRKEKAAAKKAMGGNGRTRRLKALKEPVTHAEEELTNDSEEDDEEFQLETPTSGPAKRRPAPESKTEGSCRKRSKTALATRAEEELADDDEEEDEEFELETPISGPAPQSKAHGSRRKRTKTGDM